MILNNSNSKNYLSYPHSKFIMITSTVNYTGNLKFILNDYNLEYSQLSSINQIHSNKILSINKPGFHGDCDGLITQEKCNLVLSIKTADCIPMFIINEKNGYYGLIHAGWRGVVLGIHKEAINKLKNTGSHLDDISIFLGPGIQSCCFKVKDDILDKFDDKYIINKNDLFYVDLYKIIKNDLHQLGIKNKNINVSKICTFDDKNYHSYRRDREKSGRMFSIIASTS